MAKAETLKALEAKTGLELTDAAHTAAQLDALAKLPEDKLEEIRTALLERESTFKARQQAELDASRKKAHTIRVRVSARIAEFGGAFYDPDSGLTLGAEIVETELTPFVNQKLGTRELEQVRD